MKTFCFFESNELKPSFEVIPLGFSFFALFFGPLWGLANKLWSISFVWILSSITIYFASKILFYSSFFFLTILTSNLFWGIYGRDMLIQFLIKKNYLPKKIISSDSEKNAVIIFLSEKM